MGVGFAKLTQPDYCKRAVQTKKPQLLVIPYSHFCELAVWSLQIGNIPCEFHGFAPGQHLLPVLALRQGLDSHLSDSSYIQAVKNSEKTKTDAQDVDAKKGRSTAVPVMAMPDGSVLVDSWSIAKASGLPPIDTTYKAIYDEELGPLTRQLAYSFLLKPENSNVWNSLCTEGRDYFWLSIYWLGFGSQVKSILNKTFASDNAAANAECRSKLVAVFDKLGERVRNRTGRYLNGDVLGLEDIAMASLAAPAVMPPEYCGGAYSKSFLQLEAQDAALQEDVRYWRGTDVGKYVLELYRELRVSPAGKGK